MNSIPSIFNERQINRVVLGGKENPKEVKINVCVVLLNKQSSQFRIGVLETLKASGFKRIISIETNKDNYNLEEYVNRFPTVKFISPLEKVTEGELINIGINEAESDYVLVLKDSLKIEKDILTAGIAEKLISKDQFCIAPRLLSPDCPSIPLSFKPSCNGNVFKIESGTSIFDGIETLYPFDSIGFYNKKKFIQLGGFDYTIQSSYWQNIDLSFRAWLWGEKISVSTIFSASYVQSSPVENTTCDISYSRFYLKNLLVRYDDDHGVIPKSSFLVYLLRSGCGLIESIKQFNDAVKWVHKNRYRFKIDSKFLVENWGKI